MSGAAPDAPQPPAVGAAPGHGAGDRPAGRGAGPGAAPSLPLLDSPSCVHCGFCLPECPTYDVLGTELDNPRGRLALMDALRAGRIEPTASVVRHLDLCLGCRACESACPSGVRYGERLEETRGALRGSRRRPWRERRLEAAVLRAVALGPGVQRVGSAWLRAVRRLARATRRRWEPRATGRIGAALRLLTAASLSPPRLRRVTPAQGQRRLRVGLLTGCVARWMFGPVHEATVRLLSAAGCEVVVPRGQRCCGALHLHAGDRRRAARLARRNVAAFAAAGELDAIVVNAAGCGSAMKDYGRLLAGDVRLAEAAQSFAARTRDALELLAELGLPPPRREVRGRVAYHDACHLAHGQGVRSQPRELLAAVPGLELVPLAASDRCCGSAGLYNVLHPEVADELLRDKLERLVEADVDVVAAANPGCLLHLAAGLAELRGRRGAMRAMHPLEILDRACRPPTT